MEKQIQHYENKLKYEIDSWDLSEAIKNKENIIVLDVRSKELYEVEHIPVALNFPHRTMNEESTKDLDKEMLYICYCDGIGCNASTKGALNMAKLGFKTKELMGGLDWWKRDGHKTTLQDEKNINCGC
jgi:rhodanese-related sulfurtransferase